MLSTSRLGTVALLVLIARAAHAEDSDDREKAAARTANDPLPQESVMRVEPDYTFRSGGVYTVETKFQPSLVYSGFLIPGLVVPTFDSIARLQFYVRSINNRPGNVHATGLSDLQMANGITHMFSRQLAVGIGYVTVLPMATSSGLDSQQWQLGPALFVSSTPTESLQLAVLIEDFWSVAWQPGSPRLAQMTIQPFVTYHLPHGVFINSDATMTVDFAGNGNTSIPLDLGLGKAFSPSFVGAVQGWYTVAGQGRNDVAIHLKLIFPLG